MNHLNPVRSLSHNPLFQVMFALQNTGIGQLELPGLQSQLKHTDNQSAKFDLNLELTEHTTPSGTDKNAITTLSGRLEYSTALFDQSTINQLIRHFQTLLQGFVDTPDTSLAELPLWSQAEQDEWLHTLNDSTSNTTKSPIKNTKTNLPDNLSIHQLFEQQVKQNPDNIAVIFEQQSLTYHALNQQANRLAHDLIARGVKPDTLVGICVERTPAMVVAILAVLKAGGAYVPFDPNYPQQRLDYMVNDSGINLLLSQHSLNLSMAAKSLTTLWLDDDSFDKSLQQYSTDNPPKPPRFSHNNLAYVIYTSGSTGLPKGVMIEHRNTLGLIDWATQYFSADALACVLASTSLNFDLSIFELFVPLTLGHRCVIVLNILALAEPSFVDPGLSLINTVPSGIQALVDQNTLPEGVKVINLAGEPLTKTLVNQVQTLSPQATVVNLYGPSEDTTYSTVMTMAANLDVEPGIGKPINHTQVYILSQHGQLQPPGVIGELHIGGHGLARGYLNRPDLTAQRFIQHPFGEGRLYKTGDLVRYLPAGQTRPEGYLEFIGRIDNQVKVRGFRIELGEIEQQLSQLPQVKSAEVLAREDQPGHQQLVAYIVATEDSPSTHQSELFDTLREGLKTVLPDYMLPSLFVLLDLWPLTPNGKIDRKALPAPDATQQTEQYIAPITETETKLVQIWSELLQLKADTLSTTASFFESGGHSLLSVRLMAEVRSQLKVELQVRDIFDQPQLSKLAQWINHNADQTTHAPIAAMTEIVAIKRDRSLSTALSTTTLPASFAQQRLWFIDQMEGGSSQYNMPGTLRFKGHFDDTVIEQAFARIVERHEPLRTVFVNSDNGVQQVIRHQAGLTLSRMDFTTLSPQAQEQAVQQAARADAGQSFQLDQDLMLRLCFIRLSDDEGVLLFNMHHIASDGWSMGLLVDEF